MLASIHPDGARPAVTAQQAVPLELARNRIDDLREANVRRAAHGVGDHVRNTLPLAGGARRFVPALGLAADRFVEREPGVITKPHASPMLQVFMERGGPFA